MKQYCIQEGGKKKNHRQWLSIVWVGYFILQGCITTSGQDTRAQLQTVDGHGQLSSLSSEVLLFEPPEQKATTFTLSEGKMFCSALELN